MSRWFGRNAENSEPEKYHNVISGLQALYKKNIYSLEYDYRFHQFYSPLLTDGDFAAKPMCMLLGQYSTGKTTFIRHLLERDYPGLRIGPEPTTDKFVAVMAGNSDQVIPGNAAVVEPSKPFSQLAIFGSAFLSRFECAVMDNPLLRGITLIDTPGVLSGAKQTSRGYDFEGVIGWFAERVDLILLIFDAHKLDISDEFRRCIYALRGNDSKIRILLNKADMVSNQQLMRIYGALMWSLGKVIPTPEVARVYIGSFWDMPLANDQNRALFEAETNDLYRDIAQLPRNAAIRKLNDFIKRTKLVKVHARLLNYLRKQMPMWGRDAKKKQLIENLADVYRNVSQEYAIPLGDFAPIPLMQEKLSAFDWNKIPKLDAKRITVLDQMLQTQIPQLMKLIPSQEAEVMVTARQDGTVVEGTRTPFMALNADNKSELFGVEKFLKFPPDIHTYAQDFAALRPDYEGRVSGAKAKEDLENSKLPSSVLHRIWNLADITNDGYLDIYEYALARTFIQMKLEGYDLPQVLPPHFLPQNNSALNNSNNNSITNSNTNTNNTVSYLLNCNNNLNDTPHGSACMTQNENKISYAPSSTSPVPTKSGSASDAVGGFADFLLNSSTNMNKRSDMCDFQNNNNNNSSNAHLNVTGTNRNDADLNQTTTTNPISSLL